MSSRSDPSTCSSVEQLCQIKAFLTLHRNDTLSRKTQICVHFERSGIAEISVFSWEPSVTRGHGFILMVWHDISDFFPVFTDGVTSLESYYSSFLLQAGPFQRVIRRRCKCGIGIAQRSTASTYQYVFIGIKGQVRCCSCPQVQMWFVVR